MTQPQQLNYESVAGRFQQRIGEITMRYEADIVVLHEQFAHQTVELHQRIAQLESEIQNLKDEPEE